jgi:peptide/nickel transport system permease protein
MERKEGFRILLRNGPGQIGLAFLIILLAVSIYVVARYPLDFGTRLWNNPANWADNPKSVPPAWTDLLSQDKAMGHKVFETSMGINKLVDRETPWARMFLLDYGESGPPTFISITLSDIEFTSKPPIISLEAVRPDGGTVILLRHVVRGPRTNEESPFKRYKSPYRLNISADPEAILALSHFLSLRYDNAISPTDLEGNLEDALFGIPQTGGQLGFTPLKGEYIFIVKAHTNNPEDSIGTLKLVLGGNSYGVMGTDSLGRDLAVGLLFGFPVALAIGLATAILSTAIGTFAGIVSGFSAGKTDTIIQRFADILTNIPLLPILIFLIFILGQKLWLVVAILVAFGWPGLAIVVRSMVLQLRSGQLVEATRALGASKWRIMFRHILFQILPFILAQMIFFTPSAILAEAGLSFLGLGDPSIPTWGQILESGFRTGAIYVGYWWWVLPPGLLIVFTAMTFVLLALGLEPVVNPRLRRNH